MPDPPRPDIVKPDSVRSDSVETDSVEPDLAVSGGAGSVGEDPGSDASDRTGRLLFGERLPLARRYAEHLATTGVEWGLVGPHEAPRVWDRHVLNCAVVADLLPAKARILDIGSGAGLPGIPLALVRPDLQVVLVEPLARRVEWLRFVLDDLELSIEVERGRAEDHPIRRRWEGADVVTSRAVAPLHRLAAWCLPLVRPGGMMLAVKGASAAAEVERDTEAIAAAGGGRPRIEMCGVGIVEPPSTVVVVRRSEPRRRRG